MGEKGGREAVADGVHFLAAWSHVDDLVGHRLLDDHLVLRTPRADMGGRRIDTGLAAPEKSRTPSVSARVRKAVGASSFRTVRKIYAPKLED